MDYHFLDLATFQQQVDAGQFLEHALVHQHRYGTQRREVSDRLARGRDVLLNIDVQGAASVRQQAATDSALRAALVTVFLTPPSLSALEARLHGRGTDAEDVIQRRLAAARAELARWPEFDFLIVSGTPEEDLHRMQAILVAERMRIERRRR
jgi:guanylate kinase